MRHKCEVTAHLTVKEGMSYTCPSCGDVCILIDGEPLDYSAYAMQSIQNCLQQRGLC